MAKKKTVGTMIKHFRELSGISQRELAKKSGVTNVAICRIEIGALRQGPKLSTLKAIARALRIKIEDLL